MEKDKELDKKNEKNNVTNKPKKNKVLLKTICSVLIFLIIITIFFVVILVNYFDNNIIPYIILVGFFSLIVLINVAVWVQSKRKSFFIISFIIAIFITISLFYYKNFSMKIEPLNHLNKKYNLSYSDMEVIKTTNYKRGWFGSKTLRSATIKYEDIEIYVYYEYGFWIDDYETKIQQESISDKILRNLQNIITKNSVSNRVILDPAYNKNDGYGYMVFLNTSDEEKLENVIRDLNRYTKSFDDSILVEYSIYITKDNELYLEMVNYDISSIKFDYSGSSIPIDIIRSITGFEPVRTTSSFEGYKKEYFINNGYEFDLEYKNPDNFKNIVFWYHDSMFFVFGINEIY